MKINYMSDLHMEWDKDHSLIVSNEMGADVLILGGDITIKNDVGWIERVSKFYKHVIYIMGNHEYYRGKLPEVCLLSKEHFNNTNVHVLEKDSVELEGKRFHGATLWTDGNNNEKTIRRIDGALNDFRIIRTNSGVDRFTARYSTIIHKETIRWLEAVVKPGDIVVTHHAPSYKSLHPRYARDPELNAAYMSNLEALVGIVQPQVWFHGHVHTSFDYFLGSTRVLCNPRGYYNYEENPAFNKNALYEVV